MIYIYERETDRYFGSRNFKTHCPIISEGKTETWNLNSFSVDHGISSWGIKHMLSLYAGDAAMFLRPDKEELTAAKALLDVFGEVSGLKCSLSKCAIAPIACGDEDIAEIAKPFPYQITQFPCS
jgi:hypothetical protein